MSGPIIAFKTSFWIGSLAITSTQSDILVDESIIKGGYPYHVLVCISPANSKLLFSIDDSPVSTLNPGDPVNVANAGSSPIYTFPFRFSDSDLQTNKIPRLKSFYIHAKASGDDITVDFMFGSGF